MTISTQTVGVVVMAVMAVSGLAVAQNVLKHQSVQERMLYYQAEELAMDIEIMEDWGKGSKVIKDYRRSYSVDIRNSNSGEPGKYMLLLTNQDTTKKTPIQSNIGVQDHVDESARTFCLTKPSNGMIRIEEGKRAQTEEGGGIC